MPDFFFRLHAPRATFPGDITPAESVLVHDHVAYWEAQLGQAVLTFGPVFAPEGVFGIGIAQFPDESAAKDFAGGDPLIRGEAGFRYDVHPMQAARPSGR